MELTAIHVDVADYIAVVTIDRPPVNALSPEMTAELTWAFDSFTDRDDVRAVILTSAGRVFCAGADIKARVGTQYELGQRWAHNRNWRECPLAIMECKKPVIAAVNGAAMGGGLALIACSDIIIASTSAVVALNEINVGLLGGARRIMRLFGHSRVRRMMFTGMRVTGPEMYRLGVSESCPEPENLMETAMEVAREIVQKSPIAIRLAKLAINTIEDMSLRDGYRFEQEMTATLSATDDAQEAMRAFIEKRPGNFTGR